MSTPEVTLRLAEHALEARDLARTRSLLSRARAAGVPPAAADLVEAALLRSEGDRVGALATLDRTLVRGEGALIARVNALRSDVHLDGADVASAARSLAAGLAVPSDRVTCALLRTIEGHIALEQERFGEAAIALLRAVELRPSPRALLLLAALSRRQRDAAAAARFTDAALRADPARPEAWLAYYEAHAWAGLTPVAREAFDTAVTTCRLLAIERPQDERPAIVSAELALRSGDLNAALLWVERALALPCGRYPAFRLRAIISLRRGHYLSAARDLEAYLTYAPGDRTATRQRAIAHHLSGDEAAARRVLAASARRSDALDLCGA